MTWERAVSESMPMHSHSQPNALDAILGDRPCRTAANRMLDKCHTSTYVPHQFQPAIPAAELAGEDFHDYSPIPCPCPASLSTYPFHFTQHYPFLHPFRDLIRLLKLDRERAKPPCPAHV